MTDLIEFLKARLDEDEETAERAQPGPWGCWPADMPGEMSVRSRNSRTGAPDPHAVATAHGLHCAKADADHIARHDPARALREVAAKRAILADYERDYWPDPGSDADLLGAHGAVTPAWVIRHLASVYSVHPDFQVEWRTPE